MQFVDFPDFLSYRYRACIYVTCSDDALSKYPKVKETFESTWLSIEKLHTSPCSFRLVFDDQPPSPEEILSRISAMTDPSSDFSLVSPNPSLPWFKYWMQLFFTYDRCPENLFLDIPICYVHISLSPQYPSISAPQWIVHEAKDIPIYNIVIGPPNQQAPTIFFASDCSSKSFYDIILTISHDKAPARLTSIRDVTQAYIDQHWHGFKNSVIRLLGFNSRDSRESVILQLKKLGDIYVSIGSYTKALQLYQQLYAELSAEDSKIEESLTLMIAISSVLSKADISVTDVLQPLLKQHSHPSSFFQASFISAFASQPGFARQVYLHLIRRLNGSEHPFANVSYPLLFEATAFSAEAGKSALYLFKAANGYNNLGLRSNSMICLWRSYHSVKNTGWPKLEQVLLLSLASLGPVPRQLHDQLQQRYIYYVPKTVEQLKRLKMENAVQLGSITAHDNELFETGFPLSPPPHGVGRRQWNEIRKKLFPIVVQPSSDIFAASAWANDSFDVYNISVGEEAKVGFKLTNSRADSCLICGLTLYCEPEVNCQVIEKVSLSKTEQFCLSLFAAFEGQFVVKGVKFLWMGVAPVICRFRDDLKIQTIKESPKVSISAISPKSAFVGLPAEFEVEVKKVDRKITSLYLLADSNFPLEAVDPKCEGNLQRWTLNEKADSQKVKLVGNPTEVGEQSVHIFVSYSDDKVCRFCHYESKFGVTEYPPLSIIEADDFAVLNSEVKKVECEGAKISVQGRRVYVEDAGDGSRLTVEREIGGHPATNCIDLRKVYCKSAVDGEEVKVTLFVLAKDVAEVRFKQPDSMSWRWSGKVKSIVNGPSKSEIRCRISRTRAFSEDVGKYIEISHGGEVFSPHCMVEFK